MSEVLACTRLHLLCGLGLILQCKVHSQFACEHTCGFSRHFYVEYFIDVFIQLLIFIGAEVVAFYWPSHNREIGTPVLLLHSSKSLLWKKLEFMFPSHVLAIFLFRSGLNCIHWSQVYYWMDNYVRGKYRSLTRYIFVAVGKLQALKLKVCMNPYIWLYRHHVYFKTP